VTPAPAPHPGATSTPEETAAVASSDTSAAARPVPGGPRVWLLSFAVWTVVGAGMAVQSAAARALVGGPADLAGELGPILRQSWVWAALCPGVLAMAARFPLVRPHRGRNALVHLAGGAVFSAVQVAAFTAMHLVAARQPLWPGPGAYGMTALQHVPYDLVLYGTVVAVYHAVAFHRAYLSRALADAQLEARLARAELDELQAGLQPRFLFETLDAISHRLEGDPAGARRAVADLSELLRWSMALDGPEVPLHRELEILDQYVALRRQHLGGGVRLEVEAGETVRGALVPRLLLQPLVEAALPGATSGRPFGLRVRAWSEGAALGLALAEDPPSAPPPPGALDHARARLARHYGEDASLDAGADGELLLRLPFREEA
jgi:two-component system LytT family sensor kinase